MRKVVLKGMMSMLCLFAFGATHAATLGIAVDSNTGTVEIPGSTETRNDLTPGGEWIKYFIPLNGGDCTFGVAGCGMTQDTVGPGGSTNPAGACPVSSDRPKRSLRARARTSF